MPTNDHERGAFHFTAPLIDLKMDRAGDPDAKGRWTMRGHAAVFNRLSHDLGGFRAKIHSGFFTKVLDGNPDVHLNREHDMRMLLARTRNGSLELREDPYGLHTWARFAATALADETATLMDGGYLDQMSFACDIDSAEWVEDTDGNITWNLKECAGLYDVTVCAQGAFPQTDSSLVASLSDAQAMFERAQADGLIHGVPKGAATISVPDLSAAVSGQDERAAKLAADGGTVIAAALEQVAAQELEVAPAGVGSGQDTIAPDGEGGTGVAARGARDLAAFKAAHSERFARLTHPE